MANPSITYWNRLEPRPRSDRIDLALRAEVHDPAWFLARQWQLGEFQGEDAGSPAYAKLTADSAPMVQLRFSTRTVPLDVRTPAEQQALAEQFPPDLSLAVELGQTFASLLVERGGSAMEVAAFVAGMGLAVPNSTARPFNPVDPASQRFLSVCAGRSIDGLKVYEVAKGRAMLPPALDTPAARAALSDLAAWAEDVFGEMGSGDPPSWDHERLEYSVEVDAVVPGGGSAVLAAHPTGEARLDWDAFDIRSLGTTVPAPTTQATVAMMPSHMRFRGMPNARFWDFETAATSFGDIQLDRRDLLKLLVVDFALIHGGDWFVMPLDMEVGMLARVASLTVRDVFGGTTPIARADLLPVSGPGRWSMFRTSFEAPSASAPPDFFLLPPAAGRTLEAGVAIEDVRLARDEMANMAFGIERTTASDIGEPRPGSERDAAVKSGVISPPSPATPPATPLRYRARTTAPVHWIPLLPVQVAGGADGEVALEKGAMLHPTPGDPMGSVDDVPAVGRLLNPAAVTPGQPYQIREEEVPRAGVRVQRVVFRARGFDGRTYLWVARRKLPGAGEAQSGLRYDTAIFTGQQ